MPSRTEEPYNGITTVIMPRTKYPMISNLTNEASRIPPSPPAFLASSALLTWQLIRSGHRRSPPRPYGRGLVKSFGGRSDAPGIITGVTPVSRQVIAGGK